jgi:hypothetical protein
MSRFDLNNYLQHKYHRQQLVKYSTYHTGKEPDGKWIAIAESLTHSSPWAKRAIKFTINLTVDGVEYPQGVARRKNQAMEAAAAEALRFLTNGGRAYHHSNVRPGHYDDGPFRSLHHSNIPPEPSERKPDDNSENPSSSDFLNAQYSYMSHSILNNVGGDQITTHGEDMF